MEELTGLSPEPDSSIIKIFNRSTQIHVSANDRLEEGRIIDGPDGQMVLIRIDNSNELFAVPCEENFEANTLIKQ